MHILEGHTRNSIVPKDKYTQQTERHSHQRNAEERIYLTDKLIYRQQCCDKVVCNNNRQPPVLRDQLKLCCQNICRAYYKYHTYEQQQNYRKYTHKVTCALTQIASNNLCNAQSLVAHQNYTREVIMHRTHKYTANGNPYKRHRTVASTKYSTKNRTCTGNIEQLYQKCSPARHRHIIHTIIECLARHSSLRVDVTYTLQVATVCKVCCHEQYKTDNKCHHKFLGFRF